MRYFDQKCYYRAHMKCDPKECFHSFTWGKGGEWGLLPTYIVASCYQSAHLWPKGGTESLHLLI